MRHYWKFTLPLLAVATLILFGGMTIKPVPAYAQGFTQSMPDLTGVNIYFSEAHGERSIYDRTEDGLSRFAGLLRLAGANLFTLEWRQGIPADADLIIIPGPTANIDPDNVARLWTYLQGGGRVLLALDAFDAPARVSRALAANTGFFSLSWSDLGVQARNDVVVRQTGMQTITLTETNDDEEEVEFSLEVPVLETDFMTRNIDAGHPITSALAPLMNDDESVTANLNSLFFDRTRSLEVDASLQNFVVTPLVFTEDPTTYGETNFNAYLADGFSEYSTEDDTPLGELIVAAAYERESIGSKMLLLGSSDFLRNGAGFVTSPAYSGAFVYPLNAQFALRSVAWLLEVEPTIANLPEPAETATPTLMPTPTPTPTPEPEQPEDDDE